ncbi:aspartate/glutamate racemase family protein [Granulosicoccaceae sp. 1_MG-2023]|nr:aspartate/glutamate racemase family protein [Granulosicoccaceae sp. 1_MG-2023]
MPDILLINPNTTETMTAAMAAAAESRLAADSRILARTAADGPASIEGYVDEVYSVPPMLEIIRRETAYDAVVIACFDDTGVEAARCVSAAPVTGICQAACQVATLLADSFAIVTTLPRSVPALEQRVLSYGFERHCRVVTASDIPVLALEQGDEAVYQTLKASCQDSLQRHRAEAIVLGCAGMVSLQERLQNELGVPVIEGVSAAVAMMDALARLPLSTSRAGGYAAPAPKRYRGRFAADSP